MIRCQGCAEPVWAPRRDRLGGAWCFGCTVHRNRVPKNLQTERMRDEIRRIREAIEQRDETEEEHRCQFHEQRRLEAALVRVRSGEPLATVARHAGIALSLLRYRYEKERQDEEKEPSP